MARKAISKKLRFEVFKRDYFRCQYCGATPPNVILHVDHINPVAEGGENNIDNLVTACAPCNLGKSATPLTDIPKTLSDRAAEVAEREAQIQGYNAILQARADRLEDECWRVAAALECDDHIESYSRRRLQSIRQFLERLSVVDVVDAAEITAAKWHQSSSDRAFRYFCAVCWNKVRAADHG